MTINARIEDGKPFEDRTRPIGAPGNAGEGMDFAIARPKRPWRRWGVAAGILALIALSVLVLLRANDRVLRVARSNVSVASAEITSFNDDIPLRGQVVPRDLFLLDAASGGRIARIFVQAGDVVQAGQPLLEFSNTSLQLQVVQQESQINQALTQLQSNEIALEQDRVSNERALATIEYELITTKRQLDRFEALYSRGFLSAAQRDQARDKLRDLQRQRPLQAEGNVVQEELRKRQLPLIRAQQAQLRRNLGTVRSKLDELIVRAPIAGKVTDFGLKLGENRNAGDRLATIVPDTGIKVSAEVDEFHLERVRTGQRARVDIDGRTHDLTISRVYPQVKDGTFTVDLLFVGATPPGLLPGQAINGRLTLGATSRALVLPAGGYLQSGGFVFVLDADGDAARRRPVRFGRRTVDQVELLDGLRAGERVIVSDYTGWDRYDRIDLE
jgi:HlyD family secretion protein